MEGLVLRDRLGMPATDGSIRIASDIAHGHELTDSQLSALADAHEDLGEVIDGGSARWVRFNLLGGSPGRQWAHAAVGNKNLDSLSENLNALDAALWSELAGAAEVEIVGALRRAGHRIKPRVKSAMLRDQLGTLDPAKVCSHIPDQVWARFGEIESEILTDALSDLEDRARRLIEDVQGVAITMIAEELGIDESKLRDAVQVAQQEDRERGIELLVLLLTRLVRLRLRDPEPTYPAVGEQPLFGTVPPSLITAVMLVVGGGALAFTPARRGAEEAPTGTGVSLTPGSEHFESIRGGPYIGGSGPATGDTVLRFTREQIEETASDFNLHVWTYWSWNGSRRPFPPHKRLHRKGWFTHAGEARITANDESFPPFPFLFPGDHNGCNCTYKIRLRLRRTRPRPGT